MDALETPRKRWTDRAVAALFWVCCVLIAAEVLIQVGIHRGRALEKEELEATHRPAAPPSITTAEAPDRCGGCHMRRGI